jgi:hypothetical protein
MAGGRAGGALDPMTRKPLNFPRKGEPLPDAKAGASGGPRTYDLPYTEWGLRQWKITTADGKNIYPSPGGGGGRGQNQGSQQQQ